MWDLVLEIQVTTLHQRLSFSQMAAVLVMTLWGQVRETQSTVASVRKGTLALEGYQIC